MGTNRSMEENISNVPQKVAGLSDWTEKELMLIRHAQHLTGWNFPLFHPPLFFWGPIYMWIVLVNIKHVYSCWICLWEKENPLQKSSDLINTLSLQSKSIPAHSQGKYFLVQTMIRSSSNLKITICCFWCLWVGFKSDFFNQQESPLKEEKCSCYNSKIDSCLVRRRVSTSLNCQEKRILQKNRNNCCEYWLLPG